MRARFVGAGIYEGNYVNGKKSGHGCFTGIDGSRYEVLLRVEELHPRGGGGVNKAEMGHKGWADYPRLRRGLGITI